MTLQSDAPDLAGLRVERRRAVFDAMAAAEVDVLVLGRPSEVAYATGARQLWTAGSRPFGPAALAVASTGRIHLLATSDDGVPPELGPDDLFGLSWNPANLRAELAAIPGLTTARRIATTSSAPGFEAFVRGIATEAELVDGAALLGPVRAAKRPAELRCIAAATDLASAALASMVAGLAPGVTERALLGVYLGRLGELGVPTPPTEGVVCATATAGPVQLRRLATFRPIEAGQLVVLDVCADVAGYEGGIGTTVVAGVAEPSGAALELAERCARRLEATIAACRPGATGADVRAAAATGGEPLPEEPIVVGVGIGVEPPVVAAGIGDESVLARSMVLAVSAWLTETGVGGWYERRLVVVDDAPWLIGDGAAPDREGRDHP
jgi:Xaa-Pro aminopeptidase